MFRKINLLKFLTFIFFLAGCGVPFDGTLSLTNPERPLTITQSDGSVVTFRQGRYSVEANKSGLFSDTEIEVTDSNGTSASIFISSPQVSIDIEDFFLANTEINQPFSLSGKTQKQNYRTSEKRYSEGCDHWDGYFGGRRGRRVVYQHVSTHDEVLDLKFLSPETKETFAEFKGMRTLTEVIDEQYGPCYFRRP